MPIRSPLNAPSLQHLVRVIDVNSAQKTAENICTLRDAQLSIRTFEARLYVGLVLSGERPLDWIIAQANQIRDEHLRRAALEVIPLAVQLKNEYGIEWFRPIGKQTVRLSERVTVPINPLGVVGVGGKIYLLWVQVWKNETLTADQFNLACSILQRKIISHDPQLVDLLWVEMSAPNGVERELQVRTLDAARRHSDEELIQVFDLVDVAIEIADLVPRKRRRKGTDPKQRDFFDPK